MGNLASAVDELFGVDPLGMPAAELGEQIVELRRQINRAEAAYLMLLTSFDRAGSALADYGSTAAWVRAELHRSPSTATRDVHLGRDLVDALPATRVAMAAGELSVEHGQVIASLRTAISQEALAAAEPHLVEWATKSTPKELRKVASHVRHSYAPDRAVRDEQDDYAARSLHASTTIAGMGVGTFVLHPAGMETVLTAIHAASRPVTGDDRSPAQRRADALVTIAELALRCGELPVTGGVKPHVTVTANLDTLTGAAGAPGADYSFGATTTGEWARRFACDAELARVVFGARGEVLDAGRAARTFTAAQTRAIIARDRHCIWPGCDAPPAWCDCHHCTHWAHGGATSVENAALLCGRHHDRIHAHGHAIIKTRRGPYQIDQRPGSDPHWQGHQRTRTTNPINQPPRPRRT